MLKVAEGEKIHRDPNGREPNGRRQKPGKGRHSADQDPPIPGDEHGAHAGDEAGTIGEHVDFEA